MRIRILPFTLMRIWILAFFLTKGSLEKVLKCAHIPYILACHLQNDAEPDLAIILMRIQINTLLGMRIRILPLNLMQIRIRNTGSDRFTR
jgi:hypothetical protein